jgi:lipoate-protein ligase B
VVSGDDSRALAEFFRCMDLHCFYLGLVEYTQALSWQETLLRKRCQGECEDTLLLLEHPAVFTLGRGGDERHLLNPRHIPVYRVGRGGDVTFHGPGQLVGYPICDLTRHGRDVHAYLRTLEAVLIAALAACGVPAHRRDGLTGVWVGEEKIASIGVGVRRWVTYHGFALNMNPDLSYFADIVPCGLSGVRMTSVARVLGDRPDVFQRLTGTVAEKFAEHFDYKEIVWQRDLRTLDSTFQTPDLVSAASQ